MRTLSPCLQSVIVFQGSHANCYLYSLLFLKVEVHVHVFILYMFSFQFVFNFLTPKVKVAF